MYQLSAFQWELNLLRRVVLDQSWCSAGVTSNCYLEDDFYNISCKIKQKSNSAFQDMRIDLS